MKERLLTAFIALIFIVQPYGFVFAQEDQGPIEKVIPIYQEPEGTENADDSTRYVTYSYFVNYNKLEETWDRIDAREWDWREHLSDEPVVVNDSNKSNVMYFDLFDDVFDYAGITLDYYQVYGPIIEGDDNYKNEQMFLTKQAFEELQGGLDYFKNDAAPRMKKELKSAISYIEFICGLEQDEANKLFGGYLATKDYDAEKYIGLAEDALEQIAYMERVTFNPQPYEIPGTETIEEEEEVPPSDVSDATNDDSPTSATEGNEIELQNNNDMPEEDNGLFLKLIGGTLTGGIIYALGRYIRKKKGGIFRPLLTKINLQMNKWTNDYNEKLNQLSEEERSKQKDMDEKVNKFMNKLGSIRKFIGAGLQRVSAVFTAIEVVDTLIDPTLTDEMKWRKNTGAAWTAAWSIVGAGVGALIPGVGMVTSPAGAVVGYTFGEMTQSFAEKAGSNLYKGWNWMTSKLGF